MTRDARGDAESCRQRVENRPRSWERPPGRRSAVTPASLVTRSATRGGWPPNPTGPAENRRHDLGVASPPCWGATSPSTSGRPTPWSTCAGAGVVLDEPSVVAVEAGSNRLVAAGARGQGDGRPHPGVGPRRPAAARRRDLRRGPHRADAALVRRPGPPEPAGPAADGRLRPERGDRRRAPRARGRRHPVRRPPGLHHRGADGRRDRRRPAGQRHGRRRWSSTSAAAPPTSRSSASAASSRRGRCGSAATRSTRRSSPTSRASTRCCSASAAPRTSRPASARPSRWPRS